MHRRSDDWLLAGAVFALVLAFPVLVEGESPEPGPALVAAAACAALLVRRSYPVAVLAVTVVATLVHATLTGAVFPLGICMIIALYTVGLLRPLRWAVVLGTVSTVVVYFTAELVDRIPRFQLHNGIQLGWFVAAVAAGIALSSQRRYARLVEERAIRAEQSREAEARRRVDEERLRIAQELHDVVGHSIAMINVQSGAAAHMFDADPGAGREALREINRASATALEEIRTTLGLLRHGGRQRAPVVAERGLADLPGLTESVRRGGLPVGFEVRGEHREVPSVVGFSVYRLVQESLTNVAKHGEAVGRVRVSLAYEPHLLRVEVRDDGVQRPAPPPGPRPARPGGMGLTGMRERIEAVGGCLEAGPAADGGFRVRAEIPTEAS
ncbi:sensor histidine kinase [Streptomyces sp. bgisy100]|uniref:sensor histidine kinase n=1 Tax=Streptomyces sp. bgisy100 TaxID=3413783 RepID=UPI003D710693